VSQLKNTSVSCWAVAKHLDSAIRNYEILRLRLRMTCMRLARCD